MPPNCGMQERDSGSFSPPLSSPLLSSLLPSFSWGCPSTLLADAHCRLANPVSRYFHPTCPCRAGALPGVVSCPQSGVTGAECGGYPTGTVPDFTSEPGISRDGEASSTSALTAGSGVHRAATGQHLGSVHTDLLPGMSAVVEVSKGSVCKCGALPAAVYPGPVGVDGDSNPYVARCWL